jgi:hypothetical protein
VEEIVGVLFSPLAAADKAEVRDHPSLVFLVTKLPKDDERILEVADGDGDAIGVDESESEVVQREGLCAPVTELTHDSQRGPMLLGRPCVIAFAPKLRPELIESKRTALQACWGGCPPTNLRRARPQATSPVRRDGCEALHALLNAELVAPRLELRGGRLDRPEGNPQPLSYPVATQEPESSGKETGTTDEHEGNGQDRSESQSRQHRGEQEPHAGEREKTTAQPFPFN